jgi:hypothetical protein
MWILMSFKINQDYIAKNLCENREKPKMHCNGNCILMKKLKQAEQNEQKQNEQNLKEKYEVLFCQIVTNFSLRGNTFFADKKPLNSTYSSFVTSSFNSDIFRPPKLNLI